MTIGGDTPQSPSYHNGMALLVLFLSREFPSLEIHKRLNVMRLDLFRLGFTEELFNSRSHPGPFTLCLFTLRWEPTSWQRRRDGR